MKIAVVTRYFPSSAEPWQGRSAYETLRVLAGKAEVRVFYPNASYPSWFRPRSRSYSKLDASYSPPDVKASYYDFPALPLISRPLNGWLAAHVLLPHIRNFAPDLIFSLFLYPDGYAALKIGKALNVPMVVMSIGSDINRIGDPISALHTRTVLREADFLVTVSDDLRKKALTIGAPPERTRTIVNGCDLSIFHVRNRLAARQELGVDPAAEAVVYIGRMDVKKGLRELVEAAVALHPKRPELRVYLVGEGPDRALIRAYDRCEPRSRLRSARFQVAHSTRLPFGWPQPIWLPCRAIWRVARMSFWRRLLVAVLSSPQMSGVSQRS